MNIIVWRENGYSYRPDTTLEREHGAYFCPEEIESLTVVPALFARVHKAGKAVGRKFTDRYFDGYGFCILISDATEGVSKAMADSLDKSTLLSPVQEIIGDVAVNFGGESVTFSSDTIHESFAEALVGITSRSSVRSGDMIVIPVGSAVGAGHDCRLRCQFGGSVDYSFDFRIF